MAGDLAAAESVCAAGLAGSRTAGHLENTARLLNRMAAIDLLARRTEDAAAHLREALQILVRAGGWFELINSLDCCGHLCAATGRPAEAVTMWAAHAALCRQEGMETGPQRCACGSNRYARPGRPSGPPRPVRPKNGAR